MKKYLIAIVMLSAALVAVFPHAAFADTIAYDAVSGSDTNVGSTITLSHTMSASANGILFCGMYLNSSATVVTMTYNLTLMTLVDTIVNGGDTESLYYLANPDSGAHNAILTASGAGNHELRCISYTGAAQVIPEAHDSSKASCSTDCTDTLTSISDNAWHVIISRSTTGNLSAGTGDVLRDSAAQNGDEFLDSNAAITPAGSHTAHWSQAGGSGINYRVGAIFAPFSAAAAVNIMRPNIINFE